MYIGLDIETTGFNPKKDHIIEIALIKWSAKDDLAEAESFQKFQTLLRPPVPIPATVIHITGITNEDVKNAPLLEEVRPQIREFIGSEALLGHNIAFDIGFLEDHGFSLSQNARLDTMDLVSLAFPEQPSFSLEALSRHLELVHKKKHRAYDDVIATFHLLKKIQDKFQNLPSPLKEKILGLLEKSRWPWKFLLLPVLSAKAGGLVTIFTFDRHKSTVESGISSRPDVRKLIAEFLKNSQNIIAECEKYELADLLEPVLKTPKKNLIARSRISNVNNIPEVAIIHEPEQYICLRRLDDFLKKEHFNDDETAFLVKCLIFAHYSKTGLQFELPFIKQERELWNLVCAEPSYCEDCSIDNCFFKKTLKNLGEKKAVILSHSTLAKMLNNPTAYNLEPMEYKMIIADVEDLEKNFSRGLSSKFHIAGFEHILENLETHIPDEKNFFNQIRTKIEIIFGLFGIIQETWAKPDEFNANEVELTAEIANSWKWQQIEQSLKNLMSLINEKSIPHYLFPKLKNRLNELYQKSAYDSHHLFKIILTAKNDLILISRPADINTLLTPNLWQKINSFALLSKIIRTSETAPKMFDFIKTELDLKEKTLTEHHLPAQYIPEIPFITPDLPQDINHPDTLRAETNFLLEKLKQEKGQTIIITNSLNNVKNLFHALALKLKSEDISVLAQNFSGGGGKIFDSYCDHREKTILIGTFDFFSAGMETSQAKFKNMILHRLHFDHPNNPEVKQKGRKYQQPFMEFCLPRTILKLKKTITLFAGQKEQTIYNLDTRLINKDYCRKILKILPSYIKIG